MYQVSVAVLCSCVLYKVLHLSPLCHCHRDKTPSPLARLGMGDKGPGWGTHTHTQKKLVVTFARSVFYRSFAHHISDIMSPSWAVNLVRVGSLNLVCEFGRQKYEIGRGGARPTSGRHMFHMFHIIQILYTPHCAKSPHCLGTSRCENIPYNSPHRKKTHL